MEYKRLEKIIKGFGNHNRLRILELLKEKPNLSVVEISEKLRIGYINTSDHIRKMTISGLLTKHSNGPSVLHKLTSRGETILVFCKRLK